MMLPEGRSFCAAISAPARAFASLIRIVVTGCVCSRAGTSSPPAPALMTSCMRWKKPAMAFGSKPALASVWMPTRSASISSLRVKLIDFCAIRPWPPASTAIGASPLWLLAPAAIAPSSTSAISGASFFESSNARCRWFWVMWPISCATTPASSLSSRVIVISPAFTAM